MMKTVMNKIAQLLYDKKGVNILGLDVRGISTMTDYFIIVEGSVDRHVRALAQGVSQMLKEEGHELLHQEGVQIGDWAVLDYGDLVIHLFIPEMREKYSLEQVWHEGKIVDFKIVTENIGSNHG